MTQRSFSLLVNPLSGGGAAGAAVVPVARALREAGARVQVTWSAGPRQVLAQVAAAADHGDVVVSVGGDGMLSSVAGEVAARGGTLGLVPAGRGNDFARMVGLPADPAAVAAVLLGGRTAPTDLLALRTGDGAPRMVAGSVYAGVDAVAGEIVDRVRWLPGPLQYPYAALRALTSYRPVAARVVVDDVVHTFRAATVVVANSAYYGSGMRIAPNASVHDGLLDIVVVEARSRWELIRALPAVYDGAHVERPEVHVLRGRRVEVSGTPAVPVGGDGEPLGRLLADPAEPAVVEVLPGVLDLLLPAG